MLARLDTAILGANGLGMVKYSLTARGDISGLCLLTVPMHHGMNFGKSMLIYF